MTKAAVHIKKIHTTALFSIFSGKAPGRISRHVTPDPHMPVTVSAICTESSAKKRYGHAACQHIKCAKSSRHFCHFHSFSLALIGTFLWMGSSVYNGKLFWERRQIPRCSTGNQQHILDSDTEFAGKIDPRFIRYHDAVPQRFFTPR